MGLVVGVVGCAINVDKGDELAQQGQYEEAIKLYALVKSNDVEYSKAQDGRFIQIDTNFVGATR